MRVECHPFQDAVARGVLPTVLVVLAVRKLRRIVSRLRSAVIEHAEEQV
jgi:hypothetical protein